MQYFKHFGTMRHDVKIKRLISKYGLEGYGLYNLTLESITESMSTASPLPDLQETCEDIAEFYNGNTAKINEMMSFMVNQSLFDLDEITGNVLCNKLYKFLDTSQTRSVELRAMIKGFRKVSQPQLEDFSDTVSDGLIQSDTVSAKTDRKEEEKKKKRKEKKENIKDIKHKHGEYKHVFLSDQEYSRLLEEWGEVELKKQIIKLDEGIQMKGYKYNDHNLTIRKWKRNEKPEVKDNFKRGGINFEL